MEEGDLPQKLCAHISVSLSDLKVDDTVGGMIDEDCYIGMCGGRKWNEQNKSCTLIKEFGF